MVLELPNLFSTPFNSLHSYGLYLKLYLHQCGPHKSILAKQLFVNEALTSIAQQVHNVRPKKAQKYNEFVQRELKKVRIICCYHCEYPLSSILFSHSSSDYCHILFSS